MAKTGSEVEKKKYHVYIGIEGEDESKRDTSEDDCWNEEEVTLETFDNLPDAMALVGSCQQIDTLQTENMELRGEKVAHFATKSVLDRAHEHIAELEAEKSSFQDDIIRFNDICVKKTRALQAENTKLKELLPKGVAK